MKELAQYRKQIRLISPPRPPPIGGAKVQHPTRTGLWFWSVFCGRYAMKFPGSDAAVVRNTQRCLLTHEGSEVAVRRRMPQYSAFFTLASLRSCLTTVVMGGIFSVLAGRAWGRRLLLRCNQLEHHSIHPPVVPRGGPPLQPHLRYRRRSRSDRQLCHHSIAWSCATRQHTKHSPICHLQSGSLTPLAEIDPNRAERLTRVSFRETDSEP